MKSKTKFDPQVIQQFFIDHTEKFVMGLVAVLFLYFAYQSFTLTVYEKYPKSPEDLKRATDDAARKIAAGPATKKPEVEAAFLPYADIIDGARRTIDPAATPMPPILDWKPIAPRRLRPAPEVFAVERLRAIPGRGAFSAPQGNAGTVGQRWVAVTGLVPYKKQMDEYRSKFEGAALQADDVPRYVGFLVQRAEVTPKSTGEPHWETRIVLYPSVAINDKYSTWSGTGGEIADPRFVDEHLALRLPPLVDGAWGEDVVCPPVIKALDRDASAEASQPVGGMAGVGAAAPNPRQRIQGPGGENPPPVTPTDILGGTDAPKPAAPSKDEEEQAKEPEYKLLRYFDFDVDPEKQYAYRIFLLLQNPNYKLDANVLEDAELAVPPLLGPIPKTEKKDAKGSIVWVDINPRYAPSWSQPCTSGRGLDNMRLLGGPVAAAKGPQEISGQVRILLWMKESGRNGNFSKPGLIRGTVLNFDRVTMKIPGAGKTTHALTPNCILVDLAGGEPLPSPKDRELVSPGLILVMDEFGNLVMHDEVAESEEWEKATKEPEKAAPTHGHEGHAGPRGKVIDDSGLSTKDLDGSKKGR